MKLYVDDLRQPPDESWTLARTNAQAIRLLATGQVEEISLDHDIMTGKWVYKDGLATWKEGSSDETFEPIAHYLALLKKHLYFEDMCMPRVRFHTANFEAGRKMAQIIGCRFDHVQGVK